MIRCSDSDLPAECAFVVQFSGAQTQSGVISGRAEHIATGRCVRFESWEELERSIASILDTGPATGRGEAHGQAPIVDH